MRLRQVTLIGLFLTCLYVSGCATALTTTYPPITETRNGEVMVGNTTGFNYALVEEKSDLMLQKQPVCRHKIQTIDVTRKQLRGVIPAIVEIPFFGLGILDLVIAGVYTRATVEETPGEIIDGSEVSVCGDFEPAGGQEVYVQYPITLKNKTLTTDPQGKIPFVALKPEDTVRDKQVSVFVREPTGMTFVRTFHNVAW